MKKTDLLGIFSGKVNACAKALGVSRYTVMRYPDEIPEDAHRRLCWWYLKTIRVVPHEFMPDKPVAPEKSL